MTQIQAAAPQTKQMAVVRTLKKHQTDRMAISTTEGYVIVQFADILYCEAMSNYCRIQLRTGQSHLVSRTLKHLQSVLPSSEFIRTHQSYLVRFDAITCAGQEIRLTNGKNIPISRSKRNALGVFLRNSMPVV